MEPRSMFFFESMLTPKIITFVYWLLLFVVLIGGFGSMFGFGMGGFSFGSFLRGLIGIVVGAVLVRIWCELLIVLFKINENVQKIAASK
ncbi:MAG: hypothetical protein A2W18_09885 [Candidatus Muproteobacteria bacterium RBG_16_60_9]|uniref:DUF4282 domain-containing protein n=1 Tax=Candidatus Muproteobacteria bacterium RBG_16_60_9 TaxID=1817755 RepID=A0A1F6VFF7_9PROT|nr:MAG: hypothetical protein A2W18_09885 [Candidatus Muproteobacteria bacterium RBG_16_60_9]